MSGKLPKSVQETMHKLLPSGEKILKTEKVRWRGHYFYAVTFGEKKWFSSASPTGECVVTEEGAIVSKETAEQIITALYSYEEFFSGRRLEQLKRSVKSGEDRSLMLLTLRALEQTYEVVKEQGLLSLREETAFEDVLYMARNDVPKEAELYEYDFQMLNRYQRVQQSDYFDMDVMLELLEKKLLRDELKLKMVEYTLDVEEARHILLAFFKRKDVSSSLGKQQQKNIETICSALEGIQSEDENSKKYAKKMNVEGKVKYTMTFNVRETFRKKLERNRLYLVKNE
jgi:hypothetical protein